MDFISGVSIVPKPKKCRKTKLQCLQDQGLEQPQSTEWLLPVKVLFDAC